MSRFKWGTVTAKSPLRVRLDGDVSALPFAPDSLVDPNVLTVGDRVRCEMTDARRVVIHGHSGGVIDTGWLPYNPEWSNVTIGNGTAWGRYRRRGNTVEWAAWFQMGSTSVMGSVPTVVLPLAGAQAAPAAISAQILDAGNTHFEVMPVWSPTSVSLWRMDTSGASAALGYIDASNPMVWAVTDWIRVGGVYECTP